tara:strand:+ start:1264 stop:1431 length:168 start_codon:yes stop_codon:yes gene_type:complete
MAKVKKLRTVCCILLLSVLLTACISTAAGAVVLVVAEVATLPFKVLGLAVDALIP